MSMGEFFHFVYCLFFFPWLIGLCFRRDFRYEKLVNEKEAVYKPGSGRITAGYAPPAAVALSFLPVFLATISLFSGWQAGLRSAGEMAMRLMVTLLLYYPILLLALPLLRRVVSARCCAMLGTLPAFFHLGVWYWGTGVIPKVVIRLPKGVLPILATVWLTGAGAVLLWKTAGHLRFRRALLAPARPVTDKDTLELWDYEQQRIERPRDKAIPLMVSPEVASPLTVGLLTRSLVTVLPDRAYTQEELELIFRHELRHVQRVDSSTKLFYTYCLALCWFYPPMWLVYRNATADLELSCDEMVLDRADDTRREHYARLLLSQAGDDRGFSTCLSGSAKALEHRLKSALHPKKRLEGTALVVLTMVALFLLSSLISVTGTYGTAKEVILDQLPGAYMTITSAERYDEEAVMATLEEVEVTWLRSGSLPNGTRLDAYFYLRTEDERQRADFMFTENGYLYVGVYADHSRDRADVGGLYRVEGDVDWESMKKWAPR